LSPTAGGWNLNFIHHFANLFGGTGDASEPIAGMIIDGLATFTARRWRVARLEGARSLS